MLTLFVEMYTTKPIELLLTSSRTIDEVLTILNRQSGVYMSDDTRLISRRLNTVMGPIATLGEYGVMNNDTLILKTHMGGPLLSHYSQSIKFLSSTGDFFELGQRADERKYGVVMAKKYAINHLIKSFSIISWKFEQNDDYLIDTSNITDKVCLYSFDRSNCTAIHEPECCQIEKSGKTIELLLYYHPSIWQSDKLYAFCINTFLHNEFNTSLRRYLLNDVKMPKELMFLIYEYAKVTEDIDPMSLFNSKNEFAGYLGGYYCGYFALES
jgi:hypothetical protein